MKRIIVMLFVNSCVCASAQMMQTMNKASKWGYKDAKTGKVIPQIYDEADDFIAGKALVKKGQTHFIIDEKGKQLVEFKQWAVYRVEANKVVCVGDSVAGEYLITGAPIVEMKFDQRLKSPEVRGVLVLQKRRSVGFLHVAKSATLSLGYEVDDFQTTFVQDGNELYFYKDARFCLKKNGKYGVIDPFMNIILPFEYDQLSPVNVYSNEPKKYLGATKNGKSGLIDYEGKVQIPFDFDFFLGQFDNGEQKATDPYVFMKDGKVVFYDLSSNKVVPKIVAGEGSYNRADCRVFLKGDKRGVIDTLGNILIPFEYDMIDFGGGIFFENQSWPTCRVINGKNCALYVPGVGLKTPFLECNSIERGKAYDKIFYIRNKGDECALLDAEFKPILKVDFKSISFSKNKLIIYDRDGKSGAVAEDGKITWE